MPCPDNGQIKISDLVAEFGGSAPHAMSEYYRNAGLVPGNNTNIPTSGQFALTNCYSAVNEIQHTHSDGDTHQDLSTIFGSNWSSTVPKRVIIPSGVTVGGTSTHAINVPTGMGGTLVMDISGNVEGASGAANGGTGGNAIYCAQTNGVTINLNSGGSIKAGGGGGGTGGTGGTGGNGGQGGQGGQGRYANNTASHVTSGFCHSSYPYLSMYCSGNNYFSCGFHSYGYNGANYWVHCWSYVYVNGGAGGAGGTSGGAGGAGGAGGRGQGFGVVNQGGTSGTSGSSGGAGSSGSTSTNGAGTGGTGGSRGTGGQGGTGGSGGTFGNSGGTGGTGSSGNTGASGGAGTNGNHGNAGTPSSGSAGASGSSGSTGGSAGHYIYNRGSITFNNSGTVAGQ